MCEHYNRNEVAVYLLTYYSSIFNQHGRCKLSCNSTF